MSILNEPAKKAGSFSYRACRFDLMAFGMFIPALLTFVFANLK